MKHESDILKRIKSYFMRRKSVDEAYRFEREMERDAFLYEAMEGYEDMLTSEIQQALDELDDRLDERSNRRGLIFTWQAAAIGLIIVAGTAVFAILGGQNEEIDTATIEENNYAPRSAQPSFKAMEGEPAYVVADSFVKDEALITNPIQEESTLPSPPDAVAYQRIEAEADMEEDLKTSDSSQPESIAFTSAGNGVQTDSVADIAANEASDFVVMEKTAQRVERSLAVQAESIDYSANAPMKKSKASETPPPPLPEGGMDAYNKYLKNNLQRSPGMPRGSVVLSFEFDRNGSPKDINVANSLCTACDAEAIRLVEEGPKWNAADRKERAVITVSFDQ
ncbi:MAG: hypothetical protein HQ500_08950 [Flavobacteriales bacterium]|nr:hypothetical protein [Flavobacteriales bacterium]